MKHKKQDYIKACETFLKKKIESINEIISETQSSANTDTKSSAGDKHETSRAMAHLENERLGGQLNILKKQLETIYSINPDSTNTNVSLGSIIVCQEFTFFISTGLGKVPLIDNSIFYAIATDSPISKNLKEKNIGDTISVGNKNETIINIM